MAPGIEWKGLDKVRAQFAEAPRIIEEELDAEIKPVIDDMRTQLQAYPAQRPRQRYKRTQTLERGWQKGFSYVVRGGEVSARLSNPVSYAPYVQTDSRQAWMHRGRWINTVEQVQQAFAGEQEAALERAANNTAKRIG